MNNICDDVFGEIVAFLRLGEIVKVMLLNQRFKESVRRFIVLPSTRMLTEDFTHFPEAICGSTIERELVEEKSTPKNEGGAGEDSKQVPFELGLLWPIDWWPSVASGYNQAKTMAVKLPTAICSALDCILRDCGGFDPTLEYPFRDENLSDGHCRFAHQILERVMPTHEQQKNNFANCDSGYSRFLIPSGWESFTDAAARFLEEYDGALPLDEGFVAKFNENPNLFFEFFLLRRTQKFDGLRLEEFRNGYCFSYYEQFCTDPFFNTGLPPLVKLFAAEDRSSLRQFASEQFYGFILMEPCTGQWWALTVGA